MAILTSSVFSLNLRERVVQAVDQGYQRTEIIKLFGVSRATIKRDLKQRRETGHWERTPIPGRPPQQSASLRAALVAQLETHPDATLEMHCYSPDFSPIEETFSKRKTCLRRVGVRTREALHEAIAQALLAVAAQDADSWFRHCGHLPQAGG